MCLFIEYYHYFLGGGGGVVVVVIASKRGCFFFPYSFTRQKATKNEKKSKK